MVFIAKLMERIKDVIMRENDFLMLKEELVLDFITEAKLKHGTPNNLNIGPFA